MTESPRLRAGDVDREATALVLRDAHAEGRLGLDEFGERLDAAFAATYVDQLPPLTADLPPVGAARSTAAGREVSVAVRTGHLPLTGVRPGHAPGTRGIRRPGCTASGPGPAARPVLLVALVAGLVLVAVAGAVWPLLWVALAAFLLRGGGHGVRRHGWHGSGPAARAGG